MVLRTLLLCLQPAKNKARKTRTLFRMLSLGFIMIALSTVTGCGSGGGSGDGPIITDGSGGGGFGAGGASVSLSWNPVHEAGLMGYFVHYGTHPSNSHGSCAYAHSRFSSSTSITVTDLAPNTTYFFTVSAYNGLESACSDEVSTVTSAI
jgi:Fibronectin type III domain